MKNKVAYMSDLDSMKFRTEDITPPKKGEVLIQLEYVGICGSDVHYFHDGRCGDFIVDGDFILGHECAGKVIELGEDVVELCVGDKVALEPGITCGQCYYCKSGKYNLCKDVQFLATPPVQGCYKNYITFPENMCFKLPKTMTTKQGALVEPFSVGMHTAMQGSITVGDKVIILGAGCIGLCALLSCIAFGATDITVVDIIDKRLQCAKDLGAKFIVNSLKEDINNENYYDKFNKVIETAGNSATIKATPYFVKNGGTIVLVGLSANPIIPYDFGKIMAKEAKIESVFRYRNIYPKAIAAIASKLVDIDKIVSHEFAFDNIQEAFNACIHDKENVVKALIKMR